MSPSERLRRLPGREVGTFLLVGGTGYVVDVVGFNVLRTQPWFDDHDPSWAKAAGVVLAVCVTYLGNSLLTWRGSRGRARAREALLFVVASTIGLGFSVVCLAVSRDLLGLRSVLDDNVSANVVGTALGTLFRFWAYRTVVFPAPSAEHQEEIETTPRVGIS